MKKILALALSIFLFLCGCTNQKENSSKLTIAVSIPPQATFVEKICGDKAHIITVIPAGASAESYEPTPKEIAALWEAKIYFSLEIPAESKGIMPNLSENTKIINLAASVRKHYPDLKIGSERDPHIWLSIKRVKKMVVTMAEEIGNADPENANFYTDNAKKYIEELENTNQKIKNIFKQKERRIFFVSHPAFGYFADEYNLTMYALEKHGHEATAKDLIKLTDIAKNENIQTVFCQIETAQKQAKTFAEEIGGKLQILEPLSPKYTENLIEMANSIGKAVK